MSILQLPLPIAANTGVTPNIKTMRVTDALATVTTAGYLSYANLQGYTVSPNDEIHCWYNADINNPNSGSFVILKPSISNGVITLVVDVSEGNVQFPVTANNLAIFASSTGVIKQTQIGDSAALFTYADQLTVAGGTAGRAQIALQPPGGAGPTLGLQPAASTGISLIVNENVATGRTYKLTDNGNSNALIAVVSWDGVTPPLVAGNMLKTSATKPVLVDAGYAIIAQTTAVFAGGGVSNAFTATGLTAASIVTANILTSTNAVSIVKAVPGANTLTITFSADPGANTTVNYIATTLHS